MISKKRFWGLALPIWVNDSDPTDFEVIGSHEELKERAVEGWQEFDGHTPHRPWVDKVKIESRKHPGQRMSRIPDVGNPWLDAGIVAFSTMGYDPSKPPDAPENAYWRKWYPADFITESFPGQFRNWFYALLAMSTMMSDGQPPFKTLLGHGLVRDQYGHEMHKTTGNSIEFIAAADKGGEITDPKGKSLPFNAIGADVMRWLYCRVNPASNLNFGPEPANEVRSKVFFKLWNTYAMFCNYAIGDGFDPTAEDHGAKPRGSQGEAQGNDFDRWLLSNLQLLIKEARAAYSSYDVMSFALACENFIEGDLSNWYVRRNKDRLHSKNADLDEAGRRDKLAAYQTLYTTLTTLCKLMAPCVPFVTEVMWQNLAAHGPQSVGVRESVHLCDFPVADESLIDEQLSQDMAAVQRVVSLGLSARQAAKLNVRQPLAELVVSPASDADRRAVERFADIITDELNVKAVRLHTAGEPLLKVSAKLNKKTAAAKLGPKLKDAEAALAKMSAADLDASPLVVAGVELAPGDVVRDFTAAQGYAGVADRGTQVAVSTTITEELKLEGLARDIIRQVQNERKNAKLDLLDKIELHLSAASPELSKAITTHRDAIATAVQAVRWGESPLSGEGVHSATVKVDGQPLAVTLRKV
jgi:isoleucyl-tRNA synthetase